MKKIILFAITALTCLASCKKENHSRTPIHQDFILRAGLADITKATTAFDGEKFKTYWDNGDFIFVDGNKSDALSGIAAGRTNADFVVPGFTPEEGQVLNVLYPGRDTDSDGMSFTLPTPYGEAPMWGSVQYPGEVTLHNVCSILSFSFTSPVATSVTGITVEALNKEAISGKFNMGYSSGAFNGTFVPAGDNSSTYVTGGTAIGASQTVSINIPMLSGTYSKGFVVKLYKDENYMQLSFFTSGKNLSADKAYVFPTREFTPDNAAYTLDDYKENILFDTSYIIAGTYNILSAAGRADCPNNTWEASKSCIASIIRDMDCDVMTLNELSDTECKDLGGILSGYSWITKENSYNGGKYVMSYCPGIIYKPSRLEKIEDGIFWLCDADADHLITDNKTGRYSYTDPEDGTVYSASQSRCCVWARFRDLVTGKELLWFAPHPHIRGDDSNSSLAGTTTCLNSGNIRSLLKQIPLVNTGNLPYIVAGDFNTTPSHVSYQKLLYPSEMKDAMEEAIKAGAIDPVTATKPNTNPGYNPPYPFADPKRMDFLWLKGFGVLSYKHIYTMYNNPVDGERLPSDHVPVKIKICYEK